MVAGDLGPLRNHQARVLPTLREDARERAPVRERGGVALEALSDACIRAQDDLSHAAHDVEAVKPRLRDSFLKVMFRHANSGGFDGSFTAGRKMEDLKSALLSAAREVMSETPVEEILITEIARQEV